MDHIVLDLEIANPVESLPGGWNDTDKMGVACCCVWQYQDQRLRVYGPDEVEELKARVLRADRVTTFKGWGFDFPVIWGLPRAHRVRQLEGKSDDLQRRIFQALGLNPNVFTHRHKGWTLDSVARSTLGVGKIGHGEDAPLWFRQGQVQRVVNYCADDVCLTRDLSDFIDRYGYVLNSVGGRGGALRVPPWLAEETREPWDGLWKERVVPVTNPNVTCRGESVPAPPSAPPEPVAQVRHRGAPENPPARPPSLPEVD